MRASAIWGWRVGVAGGVSLGRTIPATMSWRSSALVRTSWVPWITMLPLGRTLVTTAATVREIFSERVTAPVPWLLVVELVLMALAGSKPPGRNRPRLDSRPRRLSTPALMPELRELLLALEVWAESLMSIWTVRMSPTRLARWSMKKARAPVRHREFAEAAWGMGWVAETKVGCSRPTSCEG